MTISIEVGVCFFAMKPTFSGAPIASVEALARALNVSAHTLRTVAGAAANSYREFKVPKRDGGFRDVAGPTTELKTIQKRINRQVFERVAFPSYLFGSIHERDYVKNANSHAHAKLVIALDVKNFFPSIRRASVLGLFKNFFHFPDEVAALLADLCTRHDALPQGACTSSYIANLCLYDTEHRLFGTLRERDLTYTRLIDDITISSKVGLSKKGIERVIGEVASMLKSRGFTLKRSKTKVTTKDNPKELMEITGLWLNRGRPRVMREERLQVRKSVRSCALNARFDRLSAEFHQLHNSTSGRVARLAHLHHHEAGELRQQLQATLPHFSRAEIARTVGLVRALCRTPVGSRGTAPYIQRYYQVRYRINIIRRTNQPLATELLSKLLRHPPTRTKDEAIHGR